MKIQKHIHTVLRTAIGSAYGLNHIDIELSHPGDMSHGDFASNIAMRLAKELNDSPRNIAENIARSIEQDTVIDKVEVAGPGFINLFLKKEALFQALAALGDSAQGVAGNREKVMLEFGQPNTHKMPHIGHLFSYIYGESLARLLEATGAEVFRANYQGDVGPHVAKCLWALRQYTGDIPANLNDKIALLQQMYQEGSSVYLDDEGSKAEIDSLNKDIYKEDPEIYPLWLETRQWCLDYYKEFEKRLGISYNKSYLESEVYQRGLEIVKSNTGSVFEISEGAHVFRGSTHGLHDRVFITGRGTPTYEAKDLALQVMKMEQWPADKLIITTASEQNEYFNVVFKALETVYPDMIGRLRHIGFGMVNLKTGKMGSRTGNIIGAVELVDKVVDEIRERFTLDDKLSEQVGIGAVKYSFLKSNPLQDTVFDLEESISKEGNSGPYLQYTSARCNSILSKADEVISSRFIPNVDWAQEEDTLLRTLYQFPEIVEHAAIHYAPHVLCNFLFEIAQRYNAVYQSVPILHEESEQKRHIRLILTKSTGQVLKKGLTLLGIATPERM